MKRGALAIAIAAAIVTVYGCNGWNDEDTTANQIAARNAARLLNDCAVDRLDAGGCSPAHVRAFGKIIFCANQRELVRHDFPVDAGPSVGSCQ